MRFRPLLKWILDIATLLMEAVPGVAAGKVIGPGSHLTPEPWSPVWGRWQLVTREGRGRLFQVFRLLPD